MPEEPQTKPIDEGRPLRDQLAARLLEAALDRPAAGEGVEGPSLSMPLLRDAIRQRASDIHVEPHGDGFRVRMRIDGIVLDGAVLTRDQGNLLINQLKVMAEMDPIPTVNPREGRRTTWVDDRELDLRITAAKCVSGERLAIRILDPGGVVQRIHEVGLSPAMLDELERWLGNVEGMFLVTGPTGSGKTTTLYAILHELKLLERTIMTIEEPVEYEIQGISQMQVERGLSFAAALKGVLRMDPDYLLMGEIRDGESARSAVDAAASGRVLMSTLHSRDAVGSVTSLRNWGMEDQEICATLSVVVAQRLVRRLCEKCRTLASPNETEVRWLRSMNLEIPEQVWHGTGCDACSQLGYAGRTGLFEIWRVDEDDYELILTHADERSIRQWLAAKRHKFLATDALAKAKAGVTSIEALRTVGGLGITSPAVLKTLDAAAAAGERRQAE